MVGQGRGVDSKDQKQSDRHQAGQQQSNSGAKLSTQCFDGVIPILQLGQAPVILRAAFFMQNFHSAFMSGVFVKDCNGEKKDRLCWAAICWHGCLCEGLVAVWGQVKKWGAGSESDRFIEEAT
jgi:hypothetical protein